MYCAGVITISDRCFKKTAEDISGGELVKLVELIPAQVVLMAVVPDELEAISAKLKEGVEQGLDFIFTTGGTGIGPRDVTPEATRQVIEKEVHGIGELLRAESLKFTKMAALSRGTAGTVENTLIVNLPGSPKAVRECMEILMPVLQHAPDMLQGKGH